MSINARFLNEARELGKRFASKFTPKWNFWLERRRKKTMSFESRFTRGQTAVLLEGQRLMNEKSLD